MLWMVSGGGKKSCDLNHEWLYNRGMSQTPSSLLETFFSQQREQSFRQGDVLLPPQKPADGVFFVKSGIVNLVFVSPEGEEVVLNVFKPGSFFPVQAVLTSDEWQSDFSFLAAEDTQVLKASLGDTREFLHTHPEVVQDLLTRIYRGLDGVFHRMAQLMAGTARGRVIQELLIRAKRFGEQEGQQVSFEINEKDLAALTGVTRETVSRVLSELKKENLVEYAHQRLVITDLEVLESTAR